MACTVHTYTALVQAVGSADGAHLAMRRRKAVAAKLVIHQCSEQWKGLLRICKQRSTQFCSTQPTCTPVCGWLHSRSAAPLQWWIQVWSAAPFHLNACVQVEEMRGRDIAPTAWVYNALIRVSLKVCSWCCSLICCTFTAAC